MGGIGLGVAVGGGVAVGVGVWLGVGLGGGVSVAVAVEKAASRTRVGRSPGAATWVDNTVQAKVGKIMMIKSSCLKVTNVAPRFLPLFFRHLQLDNRLGQTKASRRNKSPFDDVTSWVELKIDTAIVVSPPEHDDPRPE